METIKKRLLEKYGTTIRQSIQNDFSQIDDVICENFGDSITKIKAEMATIMMMPKNTPITKNRGHVVEGKKMSEMLRMLSDQESVKIIKAIKGTSMTIKKIAEITDIPRSSAYRKLASMKSVGLISQTMFVTEDQSKVATFTTCFDDISIVVSDHKISACMK